MVQLPVTGARYAIVLGGGRSARMGHDKRDLVLDGRSLLARATDACVGRQVIVAVTPALPHDVDPTGVQRVLEDPPFGGPVAGLAAGLAALPSISDGDEVLVLACDLPRVAEIVATLDAAEPGTDGVCLVDAENYPQFLAARYRRSALQAALAGDLHKRSVGRTLGGLRLAQVAAPLITADVDTPDQAEAAGVRLRAD